MHGIWDAITILWTNSEDEVVNHENYSPQDKRYKQYGLSQIRHEVQENDLYESRVILKSKVPHYDLSLRERQQEDIYKDRAMRFIKSLPIDIIEFIIERFSYLDDPVRIIEASHNEGYIPNEYIMLFAANETVDLSEKICLFTALFNIVKTTQDEIINRVDSLEVNVTELKADNQELKAQNQELKADNQEIMKQNQKIMEILRDMKCINQQLSAQDSISP